MIRRATRDDIPACARIIADWEAETDYLPDGPGADKIAAIIDDAFDAREIWVSGDPVDGYLSVDPEKNKIGGLYLARRGQGLGKALVDRAKQDRDFLWLTVFAPNTRAFAFYRREGFSLTSRLPASDGEPAVLRMEWQR
ncbi:GNAT family N-acetyltransferase [Thalassococcus sp. CAU 1522]|uniref:GNAT family N-acetyltransferase n=1 Tax=Thalassococcus arenae TaxID=2851652 RepID=A0ABS6N3R8_9RHOB|nr:GNAT family N-acetyltransferase [Thalassococcus arenae]MBV2358669.1 GNAT family N-acetyltransferase [Thalassococcus arenae]